MQPVHLGRVGWEWPRPEPVGEGRSRDRPELGEVRCDPVHHEVTWGQRCVGASGAPRRAYHMRLFPPAGSVPSHWGLESALVAVFASQEAAGAANQGLFAPSELAKQPTPALGAQESHSHTLGCGNHLLTKGAAPPTPPCGPPPNRPPPPHREQASAAAQTCPEVCCCLVRPILPPRKTRGAY